MAEPNMKSSFEENSQQNMIGSSEPLWGKNLEEFLTALTDLSKKHQIGIAEDPILFAMESDDFGREYSADEEVRLKFD